MSTVSAASSGSLMEANDAARSEDSLHAVIAMSAALGRSSNDMAAHFHADFRWMGNRGCGTKNNLAEFRRNWQLPLRAAFTERVYNDEIMFAQGEWVAGFGYIEATHSGEFMGVAPTGKRVKIRYMDFWKVVEGRIADNWVSVDYPYVLAQLGVDVFNGEGWEKFDEGRAVPPAPPG